MKKVIFLLLSLLMAEQAFSSGPFRPRKFRRQYRPVPGRQLIFRPGRVVPRRRYLPPAAVAVAGYPGLFYGGGLFFHSRGGCFFPADPPCGIFFPVLSGPCFRLQHRGRWYWVSNGNFFQALPAGGFVTCGVPTGVCLSELPEEETEVISSDESLFLFHDVLWQRKAIKGGYWFEALGPYSG